MSAPTPAYYAAFAATGYGVDAAGQTAFVLKLCDRADAAHHVTWILTVEDAFRLLFSAADTLAVLLRPKDTPN